MTQYQFTQQEFDQVLIHFQRKAALLEIAARIAKIPCVPIELESALASTKQSLLDSINQLNHPFQQSVNDSNVLKYLLITASHEKLKKVYDDLKESYPIGTESDVLYKFFEEGPFVIVSLPSKRQDIFKYSITQHHDVNIVNITKEEFDGFNKLNKGERTYLKVVSLDNKVEDLQFLNNDLDLIHRHKYVGILKKGEKPYILLSFNESESKSIFTSIENHKARVYYVKISWVLHDHLLNDMKKDDSQTESNDFVYLQIFSSQLSNQKECLETFLSQLLEACRKNEIPLQTTGVNSNSIEPSFVVSTNKKHITFVGSYISANGFWYCLASKILFDTYQRNQNTV
jgi:hypothetical protein